MTTVHLGYAVWLVFEHKDWPEGPLLTTLFVFLASTMWLTLFLAGT